jgi:hypothetical protein
MFMGGGGMTGSLDEERLVSYTEIDVRQLIDFHSICTHRYIYIYISAGAPHLGHIETTGLFNSIDAADIK